VRKLYCYLDENGLETEGRIFIVAIVVIEGDPQAIATHCEELERLSGKGKLKWGKAEQTKRLDYLRRVFKSLKLQKRLCYAVFRDTTEYEAATIEAVARAVFHFAPDGDHKAAIYIDALAKTKRRVYGAPAQIRRRRPQSSRRPER
jgi:hypothetical protein